MLPKPIDNEDLRLSDVPSESADWHDIVRFAHTFNGYSVHGSFGACGEIANEHRNETLTDLRTCLFFEQRRWNHYGRPPDAEAMAYIKSLIEQIRGRLISRADNSPL